MNYLSVCSGIEAASVAWSHLGWKPVGFSEIEQFPSAVLKHHYPETPNLGDMNDHAKWELPTIDLLVGGTPCQSFSVAGLRQGLNDPRGGLMLRFLEIAKSRRPRWVVWENVPGVLSSNGGRDFGTLIGALGELGYGWSYRVLDAQWFGVAQRRRRVFVVGCLGNTTRAAKVLFESQSVCRNPTPSRATGEKVAATLTKGFGDRGIDTDQIADGNYSIDYSPSTSGALMASDGPKGLHGQAANNDMLVTTMFEPGKLKRLGYPLSEELCMTLRADAGDNQAAVASPLVGVRRLTPTECERLQGFPDGYTQIPYKNKPPENCPDSPRYKALGNSMAVPVMRWICERINTFNKV